MKFRSEIHGLRAIAVLSVLFYHADLYIKGVRLFSGGFVGVDIFFAISGYLITRIVLENAMEGKFTYAEFYDRRIRRIAPALFLVLIVSVPAAWFLMMPDELVGFAGSVLSTIAFVSNIYFWKQDGYFAEINELKPLLHTWSLSVEEQFYVFLPPIILLLQRRCAIKNFSRAFGVSLLAFFIFSIWLAAHRPVAAFFLLPTRVWELLAGGFLAQHELFYGRPIIKNGWRAALPLLGVMLILSFVFFVRDSTRHVTIYTLAPMVGAVSILWYGESNRYIKLLTTRVFVGIGSISYSLYLWHQPVFAFMRIGFGGVGILAELLSIVVVFLISYISYKLIEQTGRNSRFISSRTLLSLIFAVAAVLIVLSLLSFKNAGYAQRFPGVMKAAEFQARENKVYDAIKMDCADLLFNCKKDLVENKPHWVLVGDSYAAKILTLSDALRSRGIDLMASFDLACPFLPGVISYDDMINKVPCEKINDMRMNVFKTLKPTTIVYIARMTYFIEGHDYEESEPSGNGPKLNIRLVGQSGEENLEPIMARKFQDTIEFLLKRGNHVIIVYPIPEYNVYPQNEIVREYRTAKSSADFEKWEDRGGVHMDYALFKRRSKRSYQAYDAIPDSPNLLRIYPEKIFCNQIVKGQCNATDHDAIYYNDPGHLSSEGAALLNAEIIDEAEKKWGASAMK